MVDWVLPGVLPVPGCYLEFYMVLPGRYLGCYFKIPASPKLLKKKRSPGDVTLSRGCSCHLVAWPISTKFHNYSEHKSFISE